MFWTNYFLDEQTRQLPAFIGSYDPLWVTVSILIAIAASFFAFEMSSRFALSGRRRIWLPFGAIVLGLGVWAMHFIGMLAFQTPIDIQYDLGITLFSLLIALLASWLAMQTLSEANKQLLLAVIQLHHTTLAFYKGRLSRVQFLHPPLMESRSECAQPYRTAQRCARDADARCHQALGQGRRSGYRYLGYQVLARAYPPSLAGVEYGPQLHP